MDAMREHIRGKVAGKPVVVVFDGGITRYNRGSDILSVLLDSPFLQRPVLLRAIDMKGKKKDAAFLAAQVSGVMRDYALQKDDIIGVASDTTAVMPAAIKLLGLDHIPCWAHVCNLMVKELYSALGISDVMQWRGYLVSQARVSALEALGLRPRKLRVPSHRFAYWEEGLRELLPSSLAPTVWDKWNAYTQYVAEDAATRPARRNTGKRARRVARTDSDSDCVATDDE